MSCWVTSSSKPRRVAAVLALALALLAGVLGGARPALAKVFLSVDEALKLAFPGAATTRQTAYLTAEQLKSARQLSGVEVPSALVSYYTAKREGHVVGTAYFDTHRVRTLPETLMIVVDPQGKVVRMEIVSFREPEEYIPRGAWYEQFKGEALDRDLQLKRGIRPVTGATLTARATTNAVRRVLAVHQMLREGRAAGEKP